jgi:small subunit ribosomal protein S13
LKIKGVGHAFAAFVPKLAGIDVNEIMGKLTDEQIAKLEDVIKNVNNYDIPVFMLNRRRDIVDGTNNHLYSSKLLFSKKIDVDRMKKIHSYKGIRHELGLPVRGQRTRGSFRKGTTAGVSKSKAGRNAAKKTSKPATGGKPSAKKK